MNERARMRGEADPSCPVCLWPAGAEAACRICGWTLQGDLTMGPSDSFDHDELERRLVRARQSHDIKAAVRATGSGAKRDQQRLAWLASLARGGAPAAGYLERVAVQVDAEDTRAPETVAGVDYVLARLVSGHIDGIAFVEIDTQGLSARALIVNDLGVPVLLPAQAEVSWQTLLPALGADTDLRLFRLAGGIGADSLGDDAVPRTLAQPTIRRGLADLLAASERMTAAARASTTSSGPRGRSAPVLDIALVSRTTGWAVPDITWREARSSLFPLAEIFQRRIAGPLATVIDKVAARAPLRYAYDLVLVSATNADGKVRLESHTLFPAGAAARPQERREARVELTAPPHAANELLLPVVARRGDKPDNWPLVQAVVMSGTRSNSTSLTVRLQRPGRVLMFARPEYPQADRSAPTWPRLLDGLPTRLGGAAETVDVAFLVELGGSDATVERRLDRVRKIIDRLQADAHSASAIRAAMFGYRDHEGPYTIHTQDDYRKLVIGQGIRSIDAVRRELDRADIWRAAPVVTNRAAPIEDALHELGRKASWRSGVRHVIFILGSRPPHPQVADPDGGTITPCQNGYSWEKELAALRERHAVECVAVVENRPGVASHYENRSWARLAADGRFTVDASLERLLQAVGFAADGTIARISLASRAPGAHGSR